MKSRELSKAIEYCHELIAETAGFSIEMFKELRTHFAFNLDKLPVGPEATDELKRVGGYSAEVLKLVREVGSVTLNSDCCFVPNQLLDSMLDEEYFNNVILENLGLGREELRLIGGDHGEGMWGLLTRSGNVIFFEVDDDYGRKAPDPCFESFMSWLRVNFVLGLVESRLEQNGVDVYEDVTSEFSRDLFRCLSSMDGRLTRDTWPYRLLYDIE